MSATGWPSVLVTLRCPGKPQRCRLGVVVATADGPQLVIRRRILVQVDLDRSERHTEDAGPLPLDDGLLTQDLGCKHLVGEPLDQWHLEQIKQAVGAVRAGDTTRRTVIITPPGWVAG